LAVIISELVLAAGYAVAVRSFLFSRSEDLKA